jgi:hypothetical protein
MTSHWSNERTPVVIFLSDGWCDVTDECIYDICHAASRRGKPLSFQTVGFGQGTLSSVLSFMARRITRFSSLSRMVDIAQKVQRAVPKDAQTVIIPSSFTEALDTVRLTTTFQGFAESLAKPRGHLLSSRSIGGNARVVEISGDTREEDLAGGRITVQEARLLPSP